MLHTTETKSHKKVHIITVKACIVLINTLSIAEQSRLQCNKKNAVRQNKVKLMCFKKACDFIGELASIQVTKNEVQTRQNFNFGILCTVDA